jgi:hypothetical protein
MILGSDGADYYRDAWERYMQHPVRKTIEMTCDDVQATYYPQKPELWMNHADWEAIGHPALLSTCAIADMPVKTSLGVPAGSVRIFDRETLRYLPVARP